MTYEDAKFCCHVRSAIYRPAYPDRLFWKNNEIPLDDRVPVEWQTCTDWEEWDPRNHDIERGA